VKSFHQANDNPPAISLPNSPAVFFFLSYFLSATRAATGNAPISDMPIHGIILYPLNQHINSPNYIPDAVSITNAGMPNHKTFPVSKTASH
jgi:hypothetical protein